MSVNREQTLTYRTNAIMAGVFYILASAAPISTIFFVGFLGGGITEITDPDYLATVSASETQVIIGMIIELVWALAVVGIIVNLLPVLKRHNEPLALGFSAFRFLESISTVAHSIILLTLLTLSKEYVSAGVENAVYFQTTGDLLLAARDWTFLVGSGLIWSLSAVILNFQLYQSQLVPRWLSIWGLLGAILSLANYAPQLFDGTSIGFLFAPIGVQEMVFAVWLIVKGFNLEALAAEPARRSQVKNVSKEKVR